MKSLKERGAKWSEVKKTWKKGAEKAKGSDAVWSCGSFCVCERENNWMKVPIMSNVVRQLNSLSATFDRFNEKKGQAKNYKWEK